ncbi:TIGR01777 family protein [Moraxella osloensis]|nr:TIGR01777 family oxidoreductase [Moraxella osloensis]PAL15596.1 TIGR01777 family protein [Moraxella osloensis]
MKILITGGSGFLGTALTQSLKTHGVKGDTASVTWVSRSVEKEKTKNIADDVISYDDLASTNERYDVIINLAGAGIADSRWTNARKQELFDSRLKPTQAVIDYIERMGNKPKLLISGSAIGWYGIQHENDPTALDETSPVTKTDFAHEICQAWEQLALTAQDTAKYAVTDAVPVAIVRTGVVMAPEGGMVGRLITPFKMGTGGKLGNGQQIMSWISRTDWVRAVIFIIEQNLTHILPTQQIYNLTNPTPISNAAFTDAMGTWLHRPTVMTLPAFVVKTMFGEMSTLLLDGQRVVPTALLDKGFKFNDLTVLDALKR